MQISNPTNALKPRRIRGSKKLQVLRKKNSDSIKFKGGIPRMAELRLQGKQIRVFVEPETYQKLKEESKKFRITLAQYAGLKLNGFEISKKE